MNTPDAQRPRPPQPVPPSTPRARSSLPGRITMVLVAILVGFGLLELGLFPVAQVTARRGIEPIVHERGGSYNHRRLPLRLAAAASRALI